MLRLFFLLSLTLLFALGCQPAAESPTPIVAVSTEAAASPATDAPQPTSSEQPTPISLDDAIETISAEEGDYLNEDIPFADAIATEAASLSVLVEIEDAQSIVEALFGAIAAGNFDEASELSGLPPENPYAMPFDESEPTPLLSAVLLNDLSMRAPDLFETYTGVVINSAELTDEFWLEVGHLTAAICL